MKKHWAIVNLFIIFNVAIATWMGFSPLSSANAAPSLTITPITWNVIGLDSNDVASGPNLFPVGARICNTDTVDSATHVVANFLWDSSDPYINLRTGSLSSISVDSLAPGACTDAYFEVEVTRNANAYDHVRRYHITATADGLGTVSTPTPRELYVEHLISQNRNASIDVQLDGKSIPNGGTMALVVGNTYTITLTGLTATQGYEQIESFINFPNTIFQTLSVQTQYSADTSATVDNPNNRLYGDGCKWESDLNSPNYRSCLATGKAGGNVTTTYQVRILSVGSINPQPLTTLIYDFSGSSYHYNADFSINVRYAYIVDPSMVTIAKNFSPDPTNAGGTTTLSITLNNPTPATIGGLNFTDTFPTAPGAMLVADPANASTTGCGSPAFAPVSGSGSISFSNGTLAPNSNCTIKVNVTVPVTGTYANTSGHLFVGATDTGNFASDSLTVNDTPPAPACVSGQTLAAWNFDSGGVASSPAPSTTNVSTASASSGLPSANLSFNSNLAVGTYSWASYGYSASFAYSAAKYLQFTINTQGYQQVQMNFSAYRKNQGPDLFNLYYSTGGEPFTNTGATFTPVPRSGNFGNYTYDFSGMTSTTGNTIFRVYPYNAGSPNSNGGEFFLDDVSFTGCGVPQMPTLQKSFTTDPIAEGGSSVLTFTLSNPNNFALSNVRFADQLPSGLTVASGTSSQCGGTLTGTAPSGLAFAGGALAAGATCTVTATVTAVEAGVYNNISGLISADYSSGTLTNTTPDGYGSDTLTVLTPPVIRKSFSPNPILPGGVAKLTFTITNPNQNEALTGVQFTDALPTTPGLMTVAPAPNAATSGCGAPVFSPAAGASTIAFSNGTIAAGGACTVSVDVTAPVTGTYANQSSPVQASISGVALVGNAASDDLTVNPPHPALALLKQVGLTGDSSGAWTKFAAVTVGTPLYYRFTIENTGDVDLSDVTLNDPTLAALGVDLTGCSWANLPHYEVGNCIVGPVSAVEGSHPNTASAQGNYAGSAVNSGTSTATYATTALTLIKSATETFFTAAGDLLHYTFQVSNSGSAPLPGPVVVSDDRASDESCPDVSTVGDLDAYFDPGESLTCNATYTVTADDMLAGSVTNQASATAGGATSNTDSITVSRQLPELSLTKTNDVAGSAVVASPFHWVLTLTNSGTSSAVFADGQTLLSDPLPAKATYGLPVAADFNNLTNSANIACGISVGVLRCAASGQPVTMGVNGSFTVTISTTPTEAGDLPNTATVDPDGHIEESDETNNNGSDTVSVAAAPVPVVVVEKTSTTTSITNAGQTVPYTFTVSNGGNVALSGITIDDLNCNAKPVYASGDTNGDSKLDLGETWTYSCNHTVSQAEMNTGGTLDNTVTVDSAESDPASDSLSIPITQAPAMTVEKSSATTSLTAPGTVTYSYLVSNTGNVTLTGVSLTDDNIDSGSMDCPSATLAVGASMTCTAAHSFTQAELDAGGTLDNTVTVDSAESDPASDSLSIPIAQAPAMTVEKSSATTSLTAPGTVTYSYLVSNNGNVTLTGVSLSDDNIDSGSMDCPSATLAVGASMTCTATHSFTQAELDAGGTLDNTVTVDSAESDPASDSLSIPITQSPAMTVEKSSATTSLSAPGTVTYSYLVSNSGNVTLTGVSLSDDNIDSGSMNCPSATLAVGASMTCTATHSFTQAELDAGGTLDNTVTASASEGATANDSLSIPITQGAAMKVSKTLTATGPFSLGDTLTYDIVVTNSGDVTLTGVSVTDVGATLGTCTPAQPASLLPGASLTCTASHVVTQDDVDAGSYTNTATADADQTTPTSDDETATIAQNPALTVSKTLTATGPFGLGDILTYDIVATNSGDVTLTGVTVSDPGVGATLGTCTPAQPASLLPGASLTCSASHVVTQDDVAAGTYTNTATADSDQTTPTSDDATATIAQNPALTVSKTLTATGPFGLNDTLTYDIVATNSGDVTLTGVSVTDVGAALGTCTPAQPASLLPGASLTCSASHAVTQDDVDAGSYTNTATADSDQTTPASDDATATIAQNPALTVSKTLTATSPFGLGDTLTYNIVVTNSGDVTLTGVSVTDVGAGATLGACTPNQPAELAPGASLTCTASHAVTQDDVDAGSYTNTATADSDQTTPTSDDETTTIAQNPALTVSKTLTATGPFSLGDTLTYDIVATNSGDVTLTGVSVTDADATLGTCTPAQPASLLPGASLTCTASHVVTQDDVDAGSYTNTATADADQTTPTSDDATATIAQNPALIVSKTLTATGPFGLGDTLTYDIVATNSGDVTLTGVSVTDVGAALGTCTPAQPASLLPGASLTCSASHAVTQDDVDAASYTNTATADADQITPTSDDETATIAQNPALTVSKTLTATGPFGLGDTLTYDIVATNSGDVTLSGVSVTDVGAGATLGTCTPNQPAELAPGASLTCPASHTVTQDDVDAGSYTNTATADSDQTTPTSDDETATMAQNPALTVSKTLTATGPFGLGDTLTYDIVATNSGDVTLTGVSITDVDAALGTCTPAQPASLLPGASLTCSASHAVTQGDVDAGSYTNTATADSDQTTPTSDDETATIAQNPALTVSKTLTATGPFGLNDTLTYDIVVTNSGDVTLTGVVVSDPGVGVTLGTCTPAQPASLLPGASLTCSASHVVTQGDVTAGTYTNTAVADSDQTDPSSDDETATITQHPAITLIKTGSLDLGTDGVASVGDLIHYTFTVTNSGDVTLTDVRISDPLITVLGGPIASLAPGASDSTTFSGSHALTQADIDSGSFTNTASVSGIPPQGEDVSATDDDTQNFSIAPAIGLSKRVVGEPVLVSAGVWDVTYELTVRNFGNVSLTNIQISDDLAKTFPAPTTFSVQSLSSGDLTANWPGYDGSHIVDLLSGDDPLAVGGVGTLRLVVRVTPAEAGPFDNSAEASGLAPNQANVSDLSQDGSNPDPDGDGNPGNNSDPTPVDFGPDLFDPPMGIKVVDETGTALLHWTVTWINNTNIVAVNAAASDEIPVGTTFVDNGVSSGYPLPADAPAGSVASGVTCADTSAQTSTQFCYYEAPTTTYPRGRIVWQGILGPDLGAQDASEAANEIQIGFNVHVADGVTDVTNTAYIDSDLNGDGDVIDSGEKKDASAETSWKRPASDVKVLPQTGFHPGIISLLPEQPAALRYSQEDLRLEIPALGVDLPVVGVPQSGDGWDVTWLGQKAGWLNGTAYPTWNGNSVITGHVWDALNRPGPFASLKKLDYGDMIQIHAFGQVYTYAVRENRLVAPDETSVVLKHEEKAWLTLITCENYNSLLDGYANRRMVRAVLVSVTQDK